MSMDVGSLVSPMGSAFRASFGRNTPWVVGSSEDYVPSVSLALIECLKLSDGGVISHELGSLFCRVYLLVCETGKT